MFFEKSTKEETEVLDEVLFHISAVLVFFFDICVHWNHLQTVTGQINEAHIHPSIHLQVLHLHVHLYICHVDL